MSYVDTNQNTSNNKQSSGQQNPGNQNSNNSNQVNNNSTPNIFASSHQGLPKENNTMTTNHQLMMSHPYYGLHNGRALNVRKNFTREVVNRLGDKVCVEFDPKHGMPVRYLTLNYVNFTKVSEDITEQAIHQIFKNMETEFDRQIQQHSQNVNLGTLVDTDIRRMWPSVYDYKKKFSEIVRNLQAEEPVVTSTQSKSWSGRPRPPHPRRLLRGVHGVHQQYGLGLLKESGLRLNSDTQKWNCHCYHRFKTENLRFISLLNDRKGVPKPLNQITGLRVNEVNVEE